MYKRSFLFYFLFLYCFGFNIIAEESPNLGKAADISLIKNWDISIGTDGYELPAGSGDAIIGKEIYNQQCIACHGAKGEGLLNDKLAGGHGSLVTDKAVKTIGSYWPYATTIFDYIRRAMPYLSPKNLTNEEVYALTAYMLYINNIIPEEMIINSEILPTILMPNKENFIISYPE
jgi:cytochrome c